MRIKAVKMRPCIGWWALMIQICSTIFIPAFGPPCKYELGYETLDGIKMYFVSFMYFGLAIVRQHNSCKPEWCDSCSLDCKIPLIYNDANELIFDLLKRALTRECCPYKCNTGVYRSDCRD